MRPLAISEVYEHLIREAQRAEAEYDALTSVRISLSSTARKDYRITCSGFVGDELVSGTGHNTAAAVKDMMNKLPCKTTPSPSPDTTS